MFSEQIMKNVKAKFHQWFGIPYRLHTTSVGSGPTVVMLHGIATSSASWNRLVPLLNNNYRCITIDLLGFGESPKPDWYGYSPEEHVKNIHYTIKKLGLNEPFILIGHSMGSLLAVHYAARHPKRVSRLVILSPPIYFTSAQVRQAEKLWREALYARAYRYLRTHKNFTLKSAGGLKTLAIKNNSFSLTEATWTSFSKSLENSIENQNVLNDLENIFCPVDIFYGNLDKFLINRNIRYLQRYGNVSLHSVKASHIIGPKYAAVVAKYLLEL